jgi:hypothetical protein
MSAKHTTTERFHQRETLNSASGGIIRRCATTMSSALYSVQVHDKRTSCIFYERNLKCHSMSLNFLILQPLFLWGPQIHLNNKDKGKGKVHPTTRHEGPECEHKYNSTLSLSSALDSVGWLTPRPGRFTLGMSRYPFNKRLSNKFVPHSKQPPLQ